MLPPIPSTSLVEQQQAGFAKNRLLRFLHNNFVQPLGKAKLVAVAEVIIFGYQLRRLGRQVGPSWVPTWPSRAPTWPVEPQRGHFGSQLGRLGPHGGREGHAGGRGVAGPRLGRRDAREDAAGVGRREVREARRARRRVVAVGLGDDAVRGLGRDDVAAALGAEARGLGQGGTLPWLSSETRIIHCICVIIHCIRVIRMVIHVRRITA